ncbi:MAG TPA: hypothetical protein DGT23_17820 [Micromonosporaceae bacterium]|nr:hypothetical protein [Micromonosporaceae bacterium]
MRDMVRRWLGADAPAVDVLSDKELAALHGALLEARKRQAEALAAASEEALRQMPAILRGSIVKILGR